MTKPPEKITAPIENELSKLEQLIGKWLDSDLSYIIELSNYLIGAGGKRIRPILVLLSALACGYRSENDDHIALATVVEFIHTASLLHDDVVDDASLRRGKKTVKALWGNSASVLVGDFLYSRAFQILYDINCVAISKHIPDATATISEGEVQQLINLNRKDLSEATYMEIITRKTATLFKVACRTGAMLSNPEPKIIQAMTSYGLNLGLAFQLVDDLIDYSQNSDKNWGQDLAEGKLTLPLIYAFENGDASQTKFLESVLGNGEAVAQVRELLETIGALAYVQNQARHYAEQAYQNIESIPSSPYKHSLVMLCQFVTKRTA